MLLVRIYVDRKREPIYGTPNICVNGHTKRDNYRQFYGFL